MNISSVTASPYAAKAAPVVGKPYPSVATSSTPTSTRSTNASEVTLSAKALELMRTRQVADETAQQFKDILAKASASDAQAAPKAFLNRLSPSDMEVLRQVHSLGDSIDVASLSNEGAANLLVQPGSAQDLDNNGLTMIGVANMFTFPPQNAPESVKAAWASATDGMSFADIPTEMIFAVGLANLHVDANSGQVTQTDPGDPNWRNPYADPDYDYKGAVSDIMSSLKYQYANNMIPQEQFQHEIGFYRRLSQAM